MKDAQEISKQNTLNSSNKKNTFAISSGATEKLFNPSENYIRMWKALTSLAKIKNNFRCHQENTTREINIQTKMCNKHKLQNDNDLVK